MTNYKRQGAFDDLNNALMEQMGRVMHASKEDAELEIQRSQAVSKLAANVVNNMNNAVQVARLLADEGMDVSGMCATMPRMLGGGKDGR